MAKKDFFLTIDTETTQDDLVADFAAVITDKKGNIFAQCAVLVNGIFTDMENHPLFHIYGDDGDLWSKKALPKRYDRYNAMVEGGQRMICSVAAINIWLAKAQAQYTPYLTAYNLSFDLGKCANTGIDLTGFADRQFCLMNSAKAKWAQSRAYRQFILENHLFKNPTKLGNMSYSTTAETMARFILGNPELEDEPHTALEDILYYELPILNTLLRTTKKKNWLHANAISWQQLQVKDFFRVK